jgi:hypothetical protein
MIAGSELVLKMLGYFFLGALLAVTAYALGRWAMRAGQRFGEGRADALRRQGWEQMPVQHCRTIGRDRYDTCPLVVIETRMRWQRVRPAENPPPSSRPAREPPPRPLPSQRPRMR